MNERDKKGRSPALRIGEFLPAQDHYYLLSDGERYARHGNLDANGIVVFPNLERAEQFCLTVARNLPGFRPLRVSAEEFIRAYEEAGAFCLAQGTRVIVARLADDEPGPA
jgi:hypothetical protein